MRIALINEWSQASKNPIIFSELESVAKDKNHSVYNVGMTNDKDHYLTYIHLGIMSSLLLNSRAVDFIITGCGTGQGALMSLNAYPGVVCGYCIDPTDAFLFCQINNGNALSLPFAKGFGWGAELNLKYIFEKMLSGEKGQGYPGDKKEIQNKNAALLNIVKHNIAKPLIDIYASMDSELLKHAISGTLFQDCFFNNCQDNNLKEFVTRKLTK